MCPVVEQLNRLATSSVPPLSLLWAHTFRSWWRAWSHDIFGTTWGEDDHNIGFKTNTREHTQRHMPWPLWGKLETCHPQIAIVEEGFRVSKGHTIIHTGKNRSLELCHELPGHVDLLLNIVTWLQVLRNLAWQESNVAVPKVLIREVALLNSKVGVPRPFPPAFLVSIWCVSSIFAWNLLPQSDCQCQWWFRDVGVCWAMPSHD